mmetsp:Transcript_19088/g.28791  ORF Transcript_19088/g.28791 Transcript_19088/m.28791 type:complete len:482 (+) Transcript_19088:133-1578(+)|eukprot:CAMPEP_0178914318 /NCGR_PEP_ID=MMETSP0786-20121207/11359_1 /TAXON_ID=186022 /ORGANISM="Thalassionema frauenfeldii, Strain CCMP 1798" /LENGTH=481 /DNA_ID=CAMNT_0020587213 /DNA_START=40 /DNA_END=1485 /DNA_ORIENTATION=+
MKFTVLAIVVTLGNAFTTTTTHRRRRRHPPSYTTALGSTTAAVNNIVLSPSSSDEDKFDNYAIGTPRVHRYLRDDDSDAAEYVMWYHARGTDLNSAENNLPPLSTGRIGRATSKNGLVWEKCNLGSGSEDEPGVSLGLNDESWWNFDTAHVGLGQVMLPMSTPAVLAEGGVYLMYYMGGTDEETSVEQYTNTNAKVKGKTIKGMTFRIGVAMSQDGLTWGRVEGDDPTGAIMVPYDKKDPNQQWMLQQRDDDGKTPLQLEEELYCGWPEVVVNSEDNVLAVNAFANNEGSSSSSSSDNKEKNNNKNNPPPFFMYYSTMLKDCKTKAIACAVSEDGFRWFKRGTCLKPSLGEDDEAGCARCTVLKNQTYNPTTKLWENNSGTGYTMYYEGVSAEDNKHRIMAATSTDGRHWTKQGVVLDIGNEQEGGWDFNGVGSPHLLRLDDGTVRMYYTGQGKDGMTAIGIAKLEGDKMFVREAAPQLRP